MKQSEFINILMRNNAKEINEMIESKGKKAKAICPVSFKDPDKIKKR